jgi:cellulose synthase (UDP-forming)
MESGKDNDNSAFSCGSGVIYRRKALEEVGGFSTWNIVEDVHTSMRLQEKGWRSVYYNYPLTKGTAPADIYGVYRQRKQWAADSLRILFWDNPFGHKGLSFKQKLQYAHLGFVYIVAAFIMPFFYITPVIAILSNEFVLTSPVSSYVIHRFPYFIAMAFAYGLINYPTPYLPAFQMWTGLFPVFIQATFVALFHRKSKPAYRVNIKPVQKQREKKTPWFAITPQLAIIVFGLFAIVYGLVVDYEIQWDFYLLNVVWIFWSVWTMSGICIAAVKKTRWAKEPEQTDTTIVEPTKLRFYPVREMVATIVLSAIVTVFFVTANPVVVQRHLTNVRESVASVLGFRPAAHKSEPQTKGGTSQGTTDTQKQTEPARP